MKNKEKALALRVAFPALNVTLAANLLEMYYERGRKNETRTGRYAHSASMCSCEECSHIATTQVNMQSQQTIVFNIDYIIKVLSVPLNAKFVLN